MKKLVAILLSLCAFAVPVLSPAISDETPSSSDYETYSVEMIQEYISICSIEPMLGFSISQPLQINNSTDNSTHAVFLYDGSDCIGIMLIAYVNDEFASSFIRGDFPQVSEVTSTGKPIVLFTLEHSLYLSSNSVCYMLTGEDVLNVLDTQAKLNLVTYKGTKVQKNNLLYNYDIMANVEKSGSGNQLNVDIVANATSPDTGNGLCWAAAIASIIRYRTNTHTLTALGLYNALKSSYSPLLYGYPKGSPKWEKRCFDINSLSKTYVSSVPNFNTIKGIIDNNRPLYSSLSALNSSGSVLARHGIDIIGYGTAYGYNNYILVDSNVTSGYVVVAGSTSGTTPFVYVTSSYTFNSFNYYIY